MLIAFSGVAQSGKSTAANYLVEKYGFKKHGFATAVKEAVYALNPIIHSGLDVKGAADEFGWDNIKTTYPEVRRLLQRMGTEVGRGIFGEDFWVDRLFADLRKKKLDSLDIRTDVVIDDVRFENEALTVKKYGGLVILVDRGTQPLNEHASEIPLPPNLIDGTLYNIGSLDELHQGIENMLDFINFKRP